MKLLTRLRLLLRDIEAMQVPHAMRQSGASLDQITAWLKARNREDARIASAGTRKRKPTAHATAHAFVHVGLETVVVLLTDPLTLQTIEELTHPDPRQQVGINLALRWGRTHKRTLTFV
jgi:hypothetical protein